MEDQESPALNKGVDFRGTPNATERVSEHLKPGKRRAPLMRYVRINLPRTTRLLLLLVIALVGASSATVALSRHEAFPIFSVILWGICGAAVVFVAVGFLTNARIWSWGAVIASISTVFYVSTLAGDPPYVWNGASIPLAASWNLMLFASIGYLVLYRALLYGVIVASPDNQKFMD